MRRCGAAVVVTLVLAAVRSSSAQVAQVGSSSDFPPVMLSLQPSVPPSVYAPPEPVTEDQGVNAGGVHFDLSVAYFTDYVFRGVEIFEPPGAEDRLNLQLQGQVSFDLGRFPHPFFGAFVNFAESDPISNFQEVRPFIGLEWTLRPLTITGGHTTYIYPDRDPLNTNEFFVKLRLDDGYFFSSQQPLLSPYIFWAYDYDKYNGYYAEAGVEHMFDIEGTGITLTAQASVGYENGIDLFGVPRSAADPRPVDNSGFQHYQLGLIGSYELNKLFETPNRYGTWTLQGYLYYTDGLEDDLRSTNQLWGGAGITFHY